jgi:phosphatidylethanolamine/phosphatidyl-N-methylethanolamine N-methyltransferase
MHLKIKSQLSRFLTLLLTPGNRPLALGQTSSHSPFSSRYAAGLLFLKELTRDPKSIGAICSSSDRLGERMARHIELPEDGYVVELGGGTGVITRSLLQHGVSASRLIVIEKSEALAAHLRQLFPEVKVIHGDAVDMETMLRDGQPVKTIVSGLPLRSLSQDAVHLITRACTRILQPDGRLIQFTYAAGDFSPWLNAGLEKINSETVWVNLPPARIEVFGGPQKLADRASEGLRGPEGG